LPGEGESVGRGGERRGEEVRSKKEAEERWLLGCRDVTRTACQVLGRREKKRKRGKIEEVPLVVEKKDKIPETALIK